MFKDRLFSPGPVETPPSVLQATAEGMWHHRSPAFQELFLNCRAKLARLAQVPNDDVLMLAASGSAAFEAGLIGSVPQGSKVLAINAGKFGERWLKVAQRYNYEVVEMRLPWGEVADPEEVAQLLSKHPDCYALLTTHSETSTGALHDVRGIAGAARAVLPDIFILVDCVTSLAVCEVDPYGWGIDGMFSGSQKGLLCPPGLAFAWLSERAWQQQQHTLPPSFYLDLRKERRAQRQGQSAFTAAVTLVKGLNAALDLLLAEGMEEVWRRRERLNNAALKAAQHLGCTPFARRPSPAVAALRCPETLYAPDIVKGLAARGITIAGGQDQAKAYLFRPSFMGYSDSYDVITLIAALEEVFKDLGQQLSYGSALGLALSYLNSSQGNQ